MDISVNGEALALDLSGKATLGEALQAVDELLDTAGSIIVGLSVDGKPLEAEGLGAVKDLPLGGPGRVDIVAQPLADIKVKAIETLLEFAALTGEALAPTGPGTGGGTAPADWPGIASGLGELAEAFSGLFASDELSFVQGFAGLAARAAGGGALDPALRSELGHVAESLGVLFRERLAEIRDPVEEMRKAARLYAAQAEELKDLPVLLQTGKDERAMKAVLLFIELFNKVIRLVPELERRGLRAEDLRVGGVGLPAFYASFNDILRRLSQAFEDKDSVLIGDLAEYEVAPRMSEFFAAIEEALPTP